MKTKQIATTLMMGLLAGVGMTSAGIAYAVPSGDDITNVIPRPRTPSQGVCTRTGPEQPHSNDGKHRCDQTPVKAAKPQSNVDNGNPPTTNTQQDPVGSTNPPTMTQAQNSVGGARSVAIGEGAQTNGDDQVAIGAGSVGAANNTTPSAFGGMTAPVGGAVSFGSVGKERQLKNVAPGVAGTDAVNISQLTSVNDTLNASIANLQAADQLNVKYDVDTNGMRLNSVSLVGGDTASPVVLKNVAAGVDDTDAVNVKQLKSLQSGIAQLGATALNYGDSSKSLITLGGANGTKITNVQAGTLGADSTDAVNGAQLNATNQQVTKNTTDITNLQQSVTDVTNGNAGLVQQEDPNGQVKVGATTGGTSVNFADGAGADRVLTGVGAGVNSNDAVNVGQLNNALKDFTTSQQSRTAATDASANWIARADKGALGSNAIVTGKNAVAVGAGSVADRDNTLSVGAQGSERQVTNVAAGTAATDAVNVQQLNDSVAAAAGASNNYTDQRVGQVYHDLDTTRKDMFGGVASAMAVAGLPQPTAPGRSMVSAATSNYHGQQGFAAGYSHVTQNDRWVVKASITGNARSDFGAVVGAGYQF